jgi:hypothetical protein
MICQDFFRKVRRSLEILRGDTGFLNRSLFQTLHLIENLLIFD